MPCEIRSNLAVFQAVGGQVLEKALTHRPGSSQNQQKPVFYAVTSIFVLKSSPEICRSCPLTVSDPPQTEAPRNRASPSHLNPTKNRKNRPNLIREKFHRLWIVHDCLNLRKGVFNHEEKLYIFP